MTETHKVEFVTCRKVCSVDPGELHVRTGETVVFSNQTMKGVRIFFSKRELFDSELETVGGRSDSRPLQVKPPQPDKPVVYHYAVFCEETNSFGVGGSNPKIIFEP